MRGGSLVDRRPLLLHTFVASQPCCRELRTRLLIRLSHVGLHRRHTIEGSIDVPEERGIIPRAVEHIFEALQGEQYIESNCTVSYLEIYNEVLNDLLAPSDKPAAKLAPAVQQRRSCTTT